MKNTKKVVTLRANLQKDEGIIRVSAAALPVVAALSGTGLVGVAGAGCA